MASEYTNKNYLVKNEYKFCHYYSWVYAIPSKITKKLLEYIFLI